MWRKRASLTPGEAASKRKVYIFALCLLFSALIWLFSKLSQETSATFHKYIQFKEFPEGLVAASQSDSVFHYRVETSGLRLFSAYFLRPADTLRVAAEGLPVIQREGRNVHVITDTQIMDILSESIEGPATVSNIRPDSVFLELVPSERKKLPVQLNADFQYAQRFRPYGTIRIEPDSVWITGPKTLVDTLEYLTTERWESGPLRESIRTTIALVKPAVLKSVALEKYEVEVEVPVTEFTESSIELNLKIDCPEEYATTEVRLFPNSVRVIYLVALRDYASVVPQMFSAKVVCPQVQPATDGRLEVTIEKHPPFVDIIAIKPSFVEYIILE